MAPMQDAVESDASMRARLVESLSNSFPGSALSKALHFMDTDASGADPLSSSCFAELRLDKSAPGDVTPDEVDDELTNLEWLQSHDLLKNIETGDRSLCTSPIDDVQKENDVLGSRSHPPHIPYNPQKHVTSKPPYSFSCLIFMAIEESPTKKLPVKDIYDWIQVNFPYFRNAPTGWKNSVRHNLSLNKCFMKVEKDRGQGIGKGSYWCVDPNFRPNLLQALRRTPYHPYHQMQMVSSANNTHGSFNDQVHNLKNSFNEPSPHLFPFLSQRLAQTKVADSSDIDVANALVQLKRSVVNRRPLHCRNVWDGHSRSPSPPEFGLEREKRMLRRKLRASRCRSPVVCTTNPSTDHTYSLTDDQIQEALLLSPSSSSVDEDYNFISDVDNDFDDDFDDHFDEDEGDEIDNEEGAVGDNDISNNVAVDTKTQFSLNESARPKENERQEAKVVPPKNSIMTRSMSSRLGRKLPELEDEEKKIREGADALLNLAGLGSLSSMQRESEKLKKKTSASAGPKKRSGLRIRLRKRTCKKTSPRGKNTCNNNNNNNRNNNNKSSSSSNNNRKKAKDADVASIQIKTEPEDCSLVKVKDEVMDDE